MRANVSSTIFFWSKIFQEIISFTSLEFYFKSVWCLLHYKQPSVFVLVSSVIGAGNHLCAVSSSNRIHIFNTSTHWLFTHDLWIICNGIDVPTLEQMIVHAYIKQIIPLSHVSDIFFC